MTTTVHILKVVVPVVLACIQAQVRSVDEFVSSFMEQHRIPGLSLAIVREGEILYEAGYGYARLDPKLPATPATVYGLGSISKIFTGVAVMKLAEGGHLRLDAPVGSYLRGLPKSWDAVTIRHLLSHTSGIREEKWAGGIVEFDRREHRQRDVIETAFGPVLFESGTGYAYRNVGFRLLGMVIEAVSRQTYWDYLDKTIFEPLEMGSTRNSDPEADIPERAQGYAPRGVGYQKRDPVTPSSAFSEGALMSSVRDLAKFDAAMYGQQVLSRRSIEAMRTPFALADGTTVDYGLGWGVRKMHGYRVVGHGGSLPGFAGSMWRFEDHNLTVIVLTNYEPSKIPRGEGERLVVTLAGFYEPALVVRKP